VPHRDRGSARVHAVRTPWPYQGYRLRAPRGLGRGSVVRYTHAPLWEPPGRPGDPSSNGEASISTAWWRSVRTPCPDGWPLRARPELVAMGWTRGRRAGPRSPPWAAPYRSGRGGHPRLPALSGCLVGHRHDAVFGAVGMVTQLAFLWPRYDRLAGYRALLHRGSLDLVPWSKSTASSAGGRPRGCRGAPSGIQVRSGAARLITRAYR